MSALGPASAAEVESVYAIVAAAPGIRLQGIVQRGDLPKSAVRAARRTVDAAAVGRAVVDVRRALRRLDAEGRAVCVGLAPLGAAHGSRPALWVAS